MKEVRRCINIIINAIEADPWEGPQLLNTFTAENIFIQLGIAVTRCVNVPVLLMICHLMYHFALIVKEPTNQMINLCEQLHEKNHEGIKQEISKAYDILNGQAAL